jgi:hypothetical protein
MKRSLFYVLAFPPALMNLLLVQTNPGSLSRYFLAGYLLAALPAVAIAITDEILSRASPVKRASWCGIVGMLAIAAMVGVMTELTIVAKVQAAASGGIAAFLIAAAYARFVEPRRMKKARA